MVVQDESGCPNSDTVIASDNRIFLDIGAQSLTGVQLKEIYTSMDDYAPKVRKPYTITKQREKWTEEEHKKFLEALKLHGRSWRKIEEHVGTKTAVQIRSHAQKFFSKVVRESNGSNESSVKSIEIPPPRPKRKPMHPYPRKLIHSVGKGISVPKQPERALFPSSSFLTEENQSPKSVLSEIGSNTLGSVASDPQSSSPSPVSSASGGNPLSLLFLTEQENLNVTSASQVKEENGDSSSVLVTSNPTPADQSSAVLITFSTAVVFPFVESFYTRLLIPDSVFFILFLVDLNFLKLDLGSKDGVCTNLRLEVPTVTLKLFGRTVLVADSCRPSSPNPETHKSSPTENCPENHQIYNERSVLTSPGDPFSTGGINEGVWIPWTGGATPMFYYMPLQKEDSVPVEVASPVPVPWWTSYGGFPFPFHPSEDKKPITASPKSCLNEVQQEESNKEGSCTGSNTASVFEVINSEKNCDAVDSESREPSPIKEDKDPYSVFQLKPSATSAFYELRTNSDKPMKGFMPYKRCLAARDAKSSTVIGEEGQGQRIRVCL